MRHLTDPDDLPELDDSAVFLGTSDNYVDQLQFICLEKGFQEKHSDYLSAYNLLHDTFMTKEFLELLESTGYEVFCLPEASPVLEKILTWSEPLTIEGLTLPPVDDKPGGLFPYQQFGIRKALDFYSSQDGKSSTFFFNHATGTGKSVLSAGLIQEMLVNQKLFDYAFVFTLKKNKKNFCKDINEFTQASALRNEGTAEKRARWYHNPDYNVFVMNYEKAHFDSKTLRELVRRKRVLFIFDEVQKILSYPGKKKNQSRKGLDLLIKSSSQQFFVPTSASVVNGNPMRYWRVFDFSKPHPLGSAEEFTYRYGHTVKFWNYNHYDTKTVWDEQMLPEVRHVIASQTHSVRKTDPGVKEFFKDTEFVPVWVELSDEDRKLYDTIKELGHQTAKEAEARGESYEHTYGPFSQCLRLLCTTPESLKYTDNAVGKALVEAGVELTSKHSSKMEMILDKIESIIDQGDKVVVFTHWSNLTLKPFSDAFRAKGINHVNHHGSMSENQAQDAQDAFKTDPAVSVFLSSDAGSHALSFPQAKYVINIECPHSYDLLMQRNDRVDRVNSYHEGITMYVYICEDTVEEKIWQENNKRRETAALLQGTKEELGRPAS